MIEVGQTIGSYQITRKLGEGGMGAVFEAVHAQIARQVAIKCLHPQYASDPQVAQRFLNEARAVNLIEHPGIIQISDLGTLSDGTAYIVMELLRGETLTDRIARRSGQLDTAEAIHLLRQVASALAAAHSAGVVHRDLKPDNIMVVRDAGDASGERAKVLDFGIAKLGDCAIGGGGKEPGAAHKLTRTGTVMGTALYMSPEQCMGAERVDAKTDVYALGVILFQMLAGRPPFMAEGLGAVMAMHIYEAPPALRLLAATCPKEIEALVVSMLSKEPTLRPSMLELMTSTEKLASSRPFVRSTLQEPRPEAGGAVQGTDSAGLLVGRATLAGAASQRTRKPGRPWLKWVVVPGLLVVANGGAWYGFVRGTPMQGSKMTSGSLVPSVQSSHATPRQGSLEPGIPATTTVAPSAGIETVLTTPPLVIVSARTLEPTTKSPGSREASGLRAQDKKVRRSKAKAGPADSLTSPSTAREAIPETPDFD